MSPEAKSLLDAMRQRRQVARTTYPNFVEWAFLNQRVGNRILSLCAAGRAMRERKV